MITFYNNKNSTDSTSFDRQKKFKWDQDKGKIFIKIQKNLSILLLPTFSKISETKYLY